MSDENGSDPPDLLDWIPSGTSNNYDPAPGPGQMLHWNDDILPVIEETDHERDATAIDLQHDAGLRGFEFRDLTVGVVVWNLYRGDFTRTE